MRGNGRSMFPPEHVKAILDYTDLIITDIKHMDSATHKKLTGQGNELHTQQYRDDWKAGKENRHTHPGCAQDKQQ